MPVGRGGVGSCGGGGGGHGGQRLREAFCGRVDQKTPCVMTNVPGTQAKRRFAPILGLGHRHLDHQPEHAGSLGQGVIFALEAWRRGWGGWIAVLDGWGGWDGEAREAQCIFALGPLSLLPSMPTAEPCSTQPMTAPAAAASGRACGGRGGGGTAKRRRRPCPPTTQHPNKLKIACMILMHPSTHPPTHP